MKHIMSWMFAALVGVSLLFASWRHLPRRLPRFACLFRWLIPSKSLSTSPVPHCVRNLLRWKLNVPGPMVFPELSFRTAYICITVVHSENGRIVTRRQ